MQAKATVLESPVANQLEFFCWQLKSVFLVKMSLVQLNMILLLTS